MQKLKSSTYNVRIWVRFPSSRGRFPDIRLFHNSLFIISYTKTLKIEHIPIYVIIQGFCLQVF